MVGNPTNIIVYILSINRVTNVWIQKNVRDNSGDNPRPASACECADCQLVAGRVRTGVYTLCLHWTQWPPLHWITQGALGLYHDQ